MTYKNLIVIAVLLIVGLVTWQIGCNSKPQVPKEPKTNAAYNKTVDSLKTLIANQESVRQNYDVQISQLNDSIMILNEVIRTNQLTINQIKRRKNEKVTAVSKFSSLDITKFLSDRYKDSIR
jgi:TolA-binding protein